MIKKGFTTVTLKARGKYSNLSIYPKPYANADIEELCNELAIGKKGYFKADPKRVEAIRNELGLDGKKYWYLMEKPWNKI